LGVLDSVTDEDIYDEKENPMQGTTLDSVTDDDLYGDNSSDSSSDSFEENPLDSVSDEDIYGGEKPLTPQETYRREVMAETFKEGKQLYDQAITEISTISNKTAPDDSSQTTREKDSSFTGNNPSIIEMNQYLNSFSEDERGYYNSKTQGKPDYEKLDFARKMHEKKKEVLNPKEKPKEKTKEKPKENEFVTAVKHLPSNLKEGFGQLKQSIQYKVSDFMKPKELKRQEAETALEASDPRNVQFTKQPKNEKRYENMDSLIADMHDKGELSDREAWDYYQEGAAREKKYAPWHEKGAATVVGLISYANPITAVAGIASQYKANLDKTGNKQQAADALVIDLTTYSAFVGAGKLWRYGKQKMIGSKVSEPLSDLVRDSGRITTEVSLPEYKKLKLKVETGKASSVEMQTLKNINEAIERDYGGKFMDVLKNKRKIKVKAVIPEEIVADMKPVKVKPIIKPKPITVFRGEGGNNKFQGRSTFVAGKNFATDKARASTFGNVKEYIVPSTAKVLKINTVGKELKDTAKELNIPYNVFLDPKKLNKELRKQGYDVLQTTERLGVGGKITKDSPIVTDIIELTPGILKEQVKPEVKPEVKPTKPIAKVVKTEIKPEVNKNSKRTATRRGIGEIIKAEDSLLIDYSIAEEMGLAKPIGKDIVFPPDRAEVLVKDFMPESIGKKITNNDSEIYINKKEVEVKKSEALITDEVEIVKEAVNSAKGTGVRIRTEDGEWMGIPSERPKGLIGKPITKATLRVEAIDRLENGTKDVPADPDYLISTKQYEKADKAIDRWQSMIMDREDYTDAKEMLKNATIEGKPKLYIDSYNQMKERVDLYDTYENKRSKAKKVETLSSKVQKQKVSPKEEVVKVYHTTPQKFEQFDDSKIGENTLASNTELGHFFVDDTKNVDSFLKTLKEEGKDISNYKTISRDIDKNKLINLNYTKKAPTVKEAEIIVRYTGTESGEVLKGQDAVDYVLELSDDPTGFIEGLLEDSASFKKHMQKNGYIGAIGDFGGGVNEYVIFSAKDIQGKKPKQKVSPKEEVLASYSVPKESLIQEAKKYKSAEEFIDSQKLMAKYEYDYRRRLPNVRGGWTKNKIIKTLKSISSEATTQSFNREIMKFNSSKELTDNIFYHGSGRGIGRLKPSITMSEREAESFGGGGYGQRYWGISLSKSRNIASNFTAQSSSGSVAPVLLKKGAVVKDMPNIEDAVELEDYIEDLWNEGVDAVKIGDWTNENSEQEIVVLNPKAVVVGRGESFAVFNKKRMESFDKEAIAKMYSDSLNNYEKSAAEEFKHRNIKFKEKYGRELNNSGESKYSKSFKTKQQLTDIYNQAQKKEFASLSKEETKKMVEVKRVQLKTTSQIERIKQKKELKIKQSELKEAKKPAESIKDFTRERRALIDLKSYETNLFLDPIEKSLSQEQREIIPFLIEKTEIPEKLGRKDLVKTYNQYKNDPAMLKIVKDIKDHFDKGWDYLQKNTDKMDVAQIEDYVTHIWQVSKKQKGVVSSWFNTRNKFLKKRYIATLKEGIDKFDLKPLVLDITEIIRIHDSIMNKVIANNNFVDKLKQANKAADVPFMARADLAPDDWVTMDNPAMTENVIIPRDAKLGEKITPELENLLAEMGVAIGRRISPVAFGKPVSKQGSYSTGKIPEIRLQRFFESRTLTHEIGHHLDKTLGLGDKFFNKFVNELFEVNKERIEILKAAGKERYATSPEEQIAEFFALFFTNPKEAIKVAPGATTYVMDLLKKDGQLTKLVDFDFENKAKILIEEQMNTMFKLPLKVHPDVYKPLNVIFGQRIRQPIIQAYEMVNGLLKKATLSLSLFHHGALTETGISIMGPAKTLKLANPFSYIYKGVIKGENVAFKETELAVDAIEHGLQLGASSDIPVQKIQKAMNELAFKSKDKFLVGKLTQYLATFNQKWDAALWNYLHDGLKLYGYEHLVGTMTKKVTTAKEMTMAKREIAQFVNDTFGGQNWDLLGVDPKTQQLATWGLLSFDWTVSTVRQALSPTGLGGIYKDNKTLRKKMGAIFWFKTFLYFGVGINSLNKMFREKDRKENPKYYRGEKRTVWSGTMFDNTVGHQTHLFIGRNKDGTERYRRWGKQFRELPELFWDYGEFSPISASIKKIGGKAAPLAQLTSEILTGHSLSGFKNRDIADKRGWDRVWGITKRIAKSPLPFSTRTIFDENSEFHVLDLMMPASKGFSKYKAINLFKQAILKKDNQRVKEIFNASQRNDLDAYGLYKTALTIVKSENSKTLKRDVKSADEAKKRFKTAKTIADKKVYARIYKTYRKENIQKEKIDLFFDRAIKELDVYHKTIKEQ